MKQKQVRVYYDENCNMASCIITDSHGREYMKFATCHPDDLDMASEKTGCSIAERRTIIVYLKGQIKNEFEPRLRGLNQLYNSIKFSKEYNKNSFEARKLRKQIYLTKKSIENIKNDIEELEEDLESYIQKKDKFYKQIRQKRGKGNNS